MKNLFLTLSFVLGSVVVLLAQGCVTGYCPATLTVHHKAGDVAPVDLNTDYKVIKDTLQTNMCWLAQNLGAKNQASASNDASDDAAGWYWEFNNKRGFSFTSTAAPDLTNTYLTQGSWYPKGMWVTVTSGYTHVSWGSTNDPCVLLLGGGWRLPTYAELNKAETFTTPANAYASYFKFHLGGTLTYEQTGMYKRALKGYFWTSTSVNATTAWSYNVNLLSTVFADMVDSQLKTNGYSVRCVRPLTVP